MRRTNRGHTPRSQVFELAETKRPKGPWDVCERVWMHCEMGGGDVGSGRPRTGSGNACVMRIDGGSWSTVPPKREVAGKNAVLREEC
jgi:hypothetical protein